ncbi:hypothetical protein HF086_008810 [Spodoptera exigua]|uniref:Peptidase M14 domain-containing protein n=1 Tax=Spodoptera exigua TaxID=7107 RepID=A0A922N080_SPOEX|nr:hypothetical protein HF086_008810 [Spodoptera exigua]
MDQNNIIECGGFYFIHNFDSGNLGHVERVPTEVIGRRVDLLTITSHHGITSEREERLKNLFPDNQPRPHKFLNKKVIFISARVHPGETPSSFVFNGFLNLLLTRNDPIAIQLRKLYVFKMIPFLNPDGVARGHYRTDTRGVNLNRVYLNPSLALHPTVYASRALIRYYHYGTEKEDLVDDSKSYTTRSIQNISENTEVPAHNQVYDMKLQEQPSQTSDASSKPSNSNMDDTSSLLNENTLRTCLGSTVHLSTSEELNFQGSNPLRPLRDTLKNSISLLMESTGSVAGYESRQSNVKVGWCQDCRLAVSKLEDTMPGITDMVPGYNVSLKVCSVVSTTSVAVSAADSAEPRTDSQSCDKLTGTGDAILQTVNQPSPKDDKPKSPTSKAGKKKGAPVTSTSSNNNNAVVKSGFKEVESGLYLYIDLHGHASKKGIFMYGNHFDDLESCVECMLLPRIMSMNNLHFHFSSCNFTERNMYLKDRRDGMSREGSGRVAVLKATGLVRSYTLECNYNTGRLVNVLPPGVRDAAAAGPAPAAAAPPPPSTRPTSSKSPQKINTFQVKHYRPKNLEVFQEISPIEVGRSLGASILDLTGQHPNSRIPCSEHRNLSAVREWLRAHTRTLRPQLTMSRLRPKTTSPPRVPLYARSKGKVTEERKENTYVGAKTDSERKRSPPVLAPRSGHDIMNLGMKFSKKNEPVKTTSRTRYLSENEPKPKTLSTKRRNILAIRKPNSSKTAAGGVAKTKVSRRSADDTESPRTSIVSGKLSKRSYSRSVRGSSARSRALASSSSDELLAGAWEDVAGGTALGAADGLALPAKRRPFPAPAPPPHLKKIRLKQAM